MSQNLFVNTNSIRIRLNLFEGPLDLLLHLIQIQRIDINAISISKITKDYLDSLELMREMDLDIAGEYLVMAATLILMKSRSLLPPSPSEMNDEGNDDPRESLIARLKEYSKFRQAGQILQKQHDAGKDIYPRPLSKSERELIKEWVIDASLTDLLGALKNVLNRHKDHPMHLIKPQLISVRDKMTYLLKILNKKRTILLSDLFEKIETKYEIIVTFFAVLELIRTATIQARQRKNFGKIRLALLGSNSEIEPDGHQYE